MIKVLPVGTYVLLGHGDEKFHAEIMSVKIDYGDVVLYNVGWWDGKSFTTHLFPENQFSVPKDTPTSEIGFHTIGK